MKLTRHNMQDCFLGFRDKCSGTDHLLLSRQSVSIKYLTITQCYIRRNELYLHMTIGPTSNHNSKQLKDN